MPGRTITLTLPDPLYERIRETAEASSRSIEEVLTQSIALSLPQLEDDLPSELRSELAALPLLSETELQDIARQSMDEEGQAQLEALADLQKHRTLTEEEQTTLEKLLDKAHRFMLRKAEVYRLLAQRGHTIFSLTSTE